MALTDKLSAIADAIRAKTGKTDSMTLAQMPTEIASITTGGGGSSADERVKYVTFVYEENGETKEYSYPVIKGDTCHDPAALGLINPTKASTAQYNYTLYGWGASDGGAADANILKNITEDKTVYAIFTATVRYYTITWLDEDGTELPGQKQWAYGTVPSYAPTKDNAIFSGWIPSVSAVTGNATYTAVWEEKGVKFRLENGTLTVYGSGEMEDYSAEADVPWYTDVGTITNIVIGDGITHIGKYAFYGCSNATSVSIGKNVTSIGPFAFSRCSKLSNVVLPNGVTSIGNYAFNKCYMLASINIPDSVTSVGSYVFQDCSSLTSIAFPDGVTTIPTYAMSGCTGLVSVTLGKNVTSIGTSAFSSVPITSIYLPATLDFSGVSPFRDCPNLAEIVVDENSPYFVAEENGRVLYTKDKTELCMVCRTKSGSYTIPDSVITIRDYAAYKCANLTNITIGANVTNIGGYSFQDCTALKSVDVPNKVTTIGSRAFGWCSAMTSATIGSSVTSIEAGAFKSCTNLTSLTFRDTSTWQHQRSGSTSWETQSVTNASSNATYFKSTYADYKWRKI